MITVFVDSDYAGCIRTRKSTSGGLAKLGEHAIKCWSSTQPIIALSSGEAEYYAIVKGGSNALGIKGLLNDFGVNLEEIDMSVKQDVEINTDSAATKAIATRRGVGKVRHIEVAELWIQERVSKKEMRIRKVKGKENPADAMTKYVGKEEIECHCRSVNLRDKEGRHELAPRTAQ